MCRRTPIHEAPARAGACFGSKSGWERPNCMVLPESLQQCPTLLGDKIGLNLMQRSTLPRQQVALFDQSSFAKLCVQGKDAILLVPSMALCQPGRCSSRANGLHRYAQRPGGCSLI